MHILFVLDTWGLIGGTERYASVVVPALLERGHRLTVLCREDQAPDFADVPVLQFEALGAGALDPNTRRELTASVAALDVDVIYVSAMRNVQAFEVLLELGPVVRYVHDHVLFCPSLNKMRETGETCRSAMGSICLQRYWLEGGCTGFKRNGKGGLLLAPLRALGRKQRELEVARRSEHLLTNSNYMLAQLLQLGCDPARTSVLYPFSRPVREPRARAQPDGEPSTIDSATRAFLARDPQRPLLLTPARLTLPDKGVDYLLTALGRVQRPFRAVIAGDGPAGQWLREKARQEGLAERVHFAGWQAGAAMEELYRRADVVICPSVWDEPFGLVGLESMAHAKPVVAFDVGGIPEWLTSDENGFLCARKDTVAMARSVERLLDDGSLRARLGERGRQLLRERFDARVHIEQLEALLTRAAR